MKLFSEHPLQKKNLLIVSCLVFLPYLALSVIIFSYFRTSQREQKGTDVHLYAAYRRTDDRPQAGADRKQSGFPDSIQSLLKKLNLISDLLLVMDPNQDGQRIPDVGDNEVSALSHSINNLLSKVEAQRHALLESEQNRHAAERDTLQLQMNPHLLFNALHWVGLNQKDRNVQAGVELLGKIYRYNLTREPFSSIADELSSAEAYVRMMCLLKDSEIILNALCPKELTTEKILRFTLQPIVENAVKHGLRPETPLNIIIHIQVGLAGFIITVSNDGKPIPPEKLERLNDSFSCPPAQGNSGEHVGLRNLAQRLALTYGRDAELHIDTQAGLTVVTVHIPHQR